MSTSSWWAPGAAGRRWPCCWPGPGTEWLSSTGRRFPATPCRPISSGSGGQPGCRPGGCSAGCAPAAARPSARSPSTSARCRYPASGRAVAGAADTYCPRRTVLDALLVEAAAESGADLIERFVVGEVIWSDGRAAGVRGRHPGSAGSSLQAAVVVGADGMHSGIARRVGARACKEHPPLTAVYYSYWSGIRGLGASFHARPGQLILTWPTNDDLTCIYVAWPRQDFHQVRRDIEGRFHAALELIPGLREAAASGRREARFTGTADLPNYYRVSAGPGWALRRRRRTPQRPLHRHGHVRCLPRRRPARRRHPPGPVRAPADGPGTRLLPEATRRPDRQRVRTSPSARPGSPPPLSPDSRPCTGPPRTSPKSPATSSAYSAAPSP